MGLRLEKITPQLVDDTLSLCPRHGFKKVFTEALAEIARQKPHTVIGTGLADVSHRLIPDLAIPNACDLLLGAPFES